MSAGEHCATASKRIFIMIEGRVKEKRYHGKPVFSFEFFPPKSEKGEQQLTCALEELAPLSPDFVSVTYGAGGTTRDKTKSIVLSIKDKHNLEVMAHLTCVGHTKQEIRDLLAEYVDRGVSNILALRGDPPTDQPDWQPVKDGPSHALELVEMAREMKAFSIGVAGFPEKHPDAPTIESDLGFLKMKMDAGAEFVVTQLFFNNDLYFNYVAKARAIGITIPIIPGIMPITSVGQISRFKEMCGCSVPLALEEAMSDPGLSSVYVQEMGLAYCAAQCADLLRRGAPGIHYYTLNKSHACLTIHAALQAMGFWI